MNPKTFNTAILTWFNQHGRKNLPWQQDISPYRVWVSEIMLQQTQVNTVIPYFERFMARFPTVIELAKAEEDSVLHLWTGLGYYARARNLHKTAKLIHAEHNDEFPESVKTLIELPGIGRSTAGAIASIAMSLRAPILDGNVKRVLCRYHAVSGWPGKTDVQNTLWDYAELYTPTTRIANYTQAMMDLGATLCTRTKPQCTHCPLSKTCEAYLTDSMNMYPNPKPKRSIPTRSAYFLILKNTQGDILLEKRPPTGIWGGLWSLPQHEDSDQLVHDLKEKTGYEIIAVKSNEHKRHTFSHFHLDMHPILAHTNCNTDQIMEPNRWRWHNANQGEEIGLAAPIKSLLENSA